MDFFLRSAWLVPIFPFFAFLLNVFFGAALQKKDEKIPALIAIATIGLSAVWSLMCLFYTVAGHEFQSAMRWFSLGTFDVKLGYLIDPLSATMMFIVTFIGGLIFIYSAGYMHGDPRFSRFFAYLSLFAVAMLWLVMADNYLLLYLGWEGVGLCSYLLIGFWFEKPSAMKAAKKAFLVTRTGDCGLALGIFLLFGLAGSFSFQEIFSNAAATHRGMFVVAAFLLFCGAIGKSAQFPLHVWLPDAMEGPTPVSALIHAATMVAAGVYLVARSFPLFELHDSSGQIITLFGDVTMPNVVAWVGAFTAFMAGTIGIAQNDIKRVLAYSTISQLGYMFLGLGVGGPAVGMFHLMTHAFFKALLFLGSGSVIHAMEHGIHAAHGHGHDEGLGMNDEKEHHPSSHIDPQDMMNMGGLASKMPMTYKTYLVGALALAGAPLLFSGFWSKDEILHKAIDSGNRGVIFFGFATAIITAFYTTRQMYLVFFGTPRTAAAEHAHDSPPVMVKPLAVLAVFAVLAGFVGTPIANGFETYMTKTDLLNLAHGAHAEQHTVAWGMTMLTMLFSIAAAGLGFVIARSLYGLRPLQRREADPVLRLGLLERFLRNKWYFDEIYDWTVIKSLLKGSSGLARVDQKIVDGTVNGVGVVTLIVSKVYQMFDAYVVDGLVNFVGWFTKTWGEGVRRVQTGLAQNYMLVIIGSAAALLVAKIFLVK